MYRKSSRNRSRRKLRKLLNRREKDWSGREDLNLRPPGPENDKPHAVSNLTIVIVVLQSRKLLIFLYRVYGHFELGTLNWEPLRPLGYEFATEGNAELS